MDKFKSKINQNAEKSKVAFEVMKTPEIVIQEEKGAQLFSLLLKAENPDWGETKTILSMETADYFKNNPLSSEVIDTIRDFHEQEIDEETLYNLALTYKHPERTESVLEMVTKYKPHVKNSQEVRRKLLEILETFGQVFSASPLAKKFATKIENDRNKRLKRLGETRQRINSLIDFFKPDSKTTDVQNISFVPTDPLYRKNSGGAFSVFPGEYIIISHIDNIDNQDHEFSHSIINPIVEKLSQQLTDKQKKKISKLASEKLRQDYGEGYFSLLCEEFIRTYNDVLKKEKSPQTYEDFAKKLDEFSEEEFKEGLKQSKNFQIRCDKLGIKSLDDLRNKSLEYFEQFEENPLRDLIFEFYQEYKKRPNKEGENFEQFVLSGFPKKLS